METTAYDKIHKEIMDIIEDKDYIRYSKFANELTRAKNCGDITEDQVEKAEQRITGAKKKKLELQEKFALQLKQKLEAYFESLESDEVLHVSHMDKGLFKRLLELGVKGVFVKQESSTKEVTFSNYDPNINDNDYEELPDYFEEEAKASNKLTVADILNKYNDLLDHIKTLSEPVEQVNILGYDAHQAILHFDIVEPIITGNAPIDKYRVRLYLHQNPSQPIHEQEFTGTYFKLGNLQPDTFYFFAVEPHNECGYTSDCKMFFLRSPNQLSPCKEVIFQSLNQFLQVPDNENFVTEVKGEHLFAVKVNPNSGMNQKIIDFASSNSSLCLLESGEMLECGMIVRFKNEESNEKNFPILEEGEAIIGSTDFYSPIPNIPIISVSCGLKFCLALSCLGDVYSWGENTHGQLGLGDCFARPLPAKIPGLPFIKSINSSNRNSIAVDIDDKIFVWGKQQGLYGVTDSEMGLLIVPAKNDQVEPRYIGEHLGKIRAVACGKKFNVVTTEKGELYVFGSNKYGQLGFDYPNGSLLPCCDKPHKLISSGVVSAKVSDTHTVVKQLNDDGSEVLLGFGRNEDQQIISRPDHPQVRSPTSFELSGKRVKQFWALEASTVIEFEDNSKQVIGRGSGFEEYLTDGCVLKSSHSEANVILRY
jgi:hypothetical protein